MTDLSLKSIKLCQTYEQLVAAKRYLESRVCERCSSPLPSFTRTVCPPCTAKTCPWNKE